VDPPLVFGTAAKARPVDDDLTLSKRNAAAIEETASHHPEKDALVDRQGAEEGERRHALRHDAREGRCDRGRVGRFGRFNPGFAHRVLQVVLRIS
jgi:hypothetical protein